MNGSSKSARGGFASRLGFMWAAVGSAVGLGNIWKFPYITGEYGGGAFVLTYLVCILVVGLPLMYSELIIGRRGGKDILGALRDLTKEAGLPGTLLSWLTGAMAVLTGFLILSFYAVVAGWAVHFFVLSVGGLELNGGAGETFGALVANGPLAAIWHTVFMAITIFVVTRGVQGGIEAACKILMPTLVGILGILLVYVAFTGGLGESLIFLFRPDFSKLSGDAVLEALGHTFFTLSLGMGVMVTYGSYLKDEIHVLRDGFWVAVLDTVIALMAGAVIFAVVFSNDLEPSAGPGLLFATLPGLFVGMPGGALVSTAFFLLVVFAALSSAISLLEVVVAYMVDEFGVLRLWATLGMGFAIWLLGLASAFGLNMPGFLPEALGGGQAVLDTLDNLTTKYLLPLGGLLIAVAAGWMLSKQDRESGFSALPGNGGLLVSSWTFLIRFVTPVLILLVILKGIGIIDFSD